MAAESDNHMNENISEEDEKLYLSSNSEENNQVSIVPNMPIVKINGKDLTSRERQNVFAMYVRTYSNAGYGSRFKTKEELFAKYPCMYAVRRFYTRAFVLVQHKQYYSKISAVCHNNTPLGKAILWHILHNLLNQPGTILEASGAVSWVLRKNKLAPIITDPEVIRVAIGLKPGEELVIHPNYDINNKDNQYYTRITYKQKNGAVQEDRKQETLFGLPIGCVYDSNDCKRECRQYIQFSQGGKSKKRTRTHRKRKTIKKNKRYAH